MAKHALEEIYRSASKLASAKHSIVLSRRARKSFDAQVPSGPVKQGYALHSFDGTGGNVKSGFSIEAGKKKK